MKWHGHAYGERCLPIEMMMAEGEAEMPSARPPGSGDVMNAHMSLSEKLVSSLALAVLLGGLASGVFAKRTDIGHGSLPSAGNASAAHANYETGRANAQGPR
jgi:hypothetical protein